MNGQPTQITVRGTSCRFVLSGHAPGPYSPWHASWIGGSDPLPARTPAGRHSRSGNLANRSRRLSTACNNRILRLQRPSQKHNDPPWVSKARRHWNHRLRSAGSHTTTQPDHGVTAGSVIISRCQGLPRGRLLWLVGPSRGSAAQLFLPG